MHEQDPHVQAFGLVELVCSIAVLHWERRMQYVGSEVRRTAVPGLHSAWEQYGVQSGSACCENDTLNHSYLAGQASDSHNTTTLNSHHSTPR